MPLIEVTTGNRTVVVKLTTEQAEVLTLRRYERMSIKGIARQRRTDRPSVRRILARAETRFKAKGINLPPVTAMRQRTVRPFSLSTQFSY